MAVVGESHVIIVALFRKYLLPILIGAAAIGAVILRSILINQGRQEERNKNNDIAIKSTTDAQKVRDNVDKSDDAIKSDPDNRRNHGV